MKYGLQLYSVRDITEQDFEGALREVANMGYAMVEPAGFFGCRAEDVAAMLKHYGLTVSGTHTSYKELLNQPIEDTVAYHKTIGCKDIIIPGAPLKTREQVEQVVRDINRLQPILAESGINLHFHNHYREFLPNQDGLVAMDILAEQTNVLFEIDTFWAFDAGRDPLAVMAQYCDRMRFIHLKDGFAQDLSNPESRAEGRSLGLGEAPVEAVRKKAIELGLGMVVESEDLDPTGLEEVKRCIDYLKTLDAKDGN